MSSADVEGTAPKAETAPGGVRGLWRARHLLRQWVRRDFTVQYRQSLLGVAWSVLQPLLLLTVYGLVLRNVLDVGSVPGNYIVFALCGLAPWTFLSSALVRSVTSLSNASSIIKQVYFPRAIVPLSSSGVSLVDLVASTVILLIAQVALNHELHLATLALAPIYLSLLLMMGAVSIVVALVGALVRDIRFLVPLAIQVGFIASPVMYPQELVPERFRWLYDLNPVARVIGAVRDATIDGRWPSMQLLVGLLVLSALLLVGAVRYASAVEHRLPDLL